MGRPRKWTKEYEQLLRDNYKNLGTNIHELKKQFSEKAIMQRAYLLGMSKKLSMPEEWLQHHINAMHDSKHYLRVFNFTDDLLYDVIEGVLLSDGHMRIAADSKKTAFLVIPQTLNEHRDEWLFFLKSFFEIYGIKTNMRQYKAKNDEKEYDQIKLRTYSYCDFYNIYKKWYHKKIKRLPERLSLSPSSLSHMFFGDGCLDLSRKGVQRNFYRIRISTDNFTEEEVKRLVFLLNSSYDLNGNVYSRINAKGNRVFQIQFSKQKDVNNLLHIMYPYRINCFDYKFRALNDPRFMKTDIVRECLHCGKEFHPLKNQKYCSVICRERAKAKRFYYKNKKKC